MILSWWTHENDMWLSFKPMCSERVGHFIPVYLQFLKIADWVDYGFGFDSMLIS